MQRKHAEFGERRSKLAHSSMSPNQSAEQSSIRRLGPQPLDAASPAGKKEFATSASFGGNSATGEARTTGRTGLSLSGARSGRDGCPAADGSNSTADYPSLQFTVAGARCGRPTSFPRG